MTIEQQADALFAGTPPLAGRALTRFGLVVCVLLGISIGAAGYTFQFAEGLSYASDDPATCVNCHIMRDEYDGWMKAGHGKVAVCNDCHLDHTNIFTKYGSKGRNGFMHSKAFTLQDFAEPIQIHEFNAAILQANCVRCHEGVVCEIVDRGKLDCVHCHRHVGHGPTR